MPTTTPPPGGSETLCDIASDPEKAAALHGLVGDFCHLLRNRLGSLQMSLYLARRDQASGGPGAWDELDRQYRAAEGVVELFQSICRPMQLTTVSLGLDLVLRDFCSRWEPRFAKRGLAFTCEFDGVGSPSRLDPSRFALALDALAAWRLDRGDIGRTFALIAATRKGKSRLEWRESGPPPTDPEGELPLAALSRVAAEHGGGVTRDDGNGWCVRIEWPS